MKIKPDHRHKDAEWLLDAAISDGSVPDPSVIMALLMDLRDEMKEANTLLRKLVANTRKPRRKPKKTS